MYDSVASNRGAFAGELSSGARLYVADAGAWAVVVCAVCSGVMAGLFFAFSCFIMQALSTLEPKTSIAAMQAINRVILNPLFFTIFLGNAVVSGLILIRAAIVRAPPDSRALRVSGALLYLLGVIVLTITVHVPLNNKLAKFSLDASSQAAAVTWHEYYNKWLPWNHVRTVTATLATLVLILSLK